LNKQLKPVLEGVDSVEVSSTYMNRLNQTELAIFAACFDLSAFEGSPFSEFV
jgi:hypothetical protein